MTNLKTLVPVTVPKGRFEVTTSPDYPDRACCTVDLTRDELETALERLNRKERE